MLEVIIELTDTDTQELCIYCQGKAGSANVPMVRIKGATNSCICMKCACLRAPAIGELLKAASAAASTGRLRPGTWNPLTLNKAVHSTSHGNTNTSVLEQGSNER